MTDLLTNLAQAEFCNKSLMLSVSEHLDVNIHTMVLNGRTTLWTLIDARAWESAALALIEEVLPGWGRKQNSPADYMDRDVVNVTLWHIPEGLKGPMVSASHKSEPLALITALLKALETGGDHD